MRELSALAGVPISSDSKSKREWATGVHDGGVWISSCSGAVTSEGFDCIICDDLLKGRAEAESSQIRESTFTWLTVDVMSRLEPGGSVVLTNTRWHPDDPIGRLFATGEWEYTNLAALALAGDPMGRAEGEPLWPARWSKERLLKIQNSLGGPSGYEWSALYQGVPLGRGSAVFQDVHFYDSLPDLSRGSIVVGLDFAYSTKTSSDWSVAVVGIKVSGIVYILDVVRIQSEPRVFRDRLQLLRVTYPSMRACAYAAATELGGIEFIREGGISVDARAAKIDKFSRAIPCAAGWNTEKILLPKEAPWLDAFVSEICGFTGVKDRHEDQVDALAACWDALVSDEPTTTYRSEILTSHNGFDRAPLGLESIARPSTVNYADPVSVYADKMGWTPMGGGGGF